MRGVDFAWGVVPGHERQLAREIRAQGFRFVVRYLSWDPSKNLTRAEVAAYRAEGLAIVTVWETTADRTLQGRVAGRDDAHFAKAQLADLGAPADAPVYFAVDFDIQPDQMPLLQDYLDAAAFALTEDRVGVYGGLEAVQAQHVRYRWQTYAWSRGLWSPSDNLLQVLNSAGTFQGISYDSDAAEGRDFGQWRFTTVHAAPAKPKRKPVRHAVRKAVHGTRHVVRHEPVVTAAGASGGLSAAVAFLAHHAGLHLTVTQLAVVLTALPALATLFAAWRTRPVAVTGISGALATVAVAALAFGLHWPASYVATDATLASAVLALLLRMHVSPVLAAGPAVATSSAAVTVPAPAVPVG